MKLIAYILLSPLVWWISSGIAIMFIRDDDKKRRIIAGSIIGLFILLAFWATLFL